MRQLPFCQSKVEYYELIQLLKGNVLVIYKVYITNILLGSAQSSESVIQWAIHKEHPSIASGINQFCSEMDPTLFKKVRNHTNAVEQTHYKSNALGRRLPLLRAIEM